MFDEEDELKGFQLGAADYIKKPFSQKILLASMREKYGCETLGDLKKFFSEVMSKKIMQIPECRCNGIHEAAENPAGINGTVLPTVIILMH